VARIKNVFLHLWFVPCDAGNLSLLKSFSVGADKKPVQSALDTESTSGTAAAAEASDAVVMVNGALVNISSVLQNLSKSEEERAQTETELMDKEQECGLYQFSHFSIDVLVRKRLKLAYSSLFETHCLATKCHLRYGITLCYLPPDTDEL